MNMNWAGVTPDQYDQVRKVVKLDADLQKGNVLHIATFDNKGLHITDIWESPEDFQNFGDKRLMPVLQQLKIPGEPVIEITPLHATLIPALQKLG